MKMKIHNKGQVVLPVKIRKKYRLEIGDNVDITYDDKGIHIYPIVEETLDLFGSLKEEYKKYGFPDEIEINEATKKGFTGN